MLFMNSPFFEGIVYHKRFFPVEHVINTKVFFLKFSLSELENISHSIFQVNRFQLFSFYSKDHGFKDHRTLLEWIRETLSENSILENFDEVYLQTFPRVFGYTFNPVSVWTVYSQGKVVARVLEVNNTFGESHVYVLNSIQLDSEKVFHVSPFFQVEGKYHFTFRDQKDEAFFKIDYFLNNKLQLTASIFGKRTIQSRFYLWRIFFTYPLQSFLVVYLIHWNALRLFLKKVPFWGKNGKKGLSV